MCSSVWQIISSRTGIPLRTSCSESGYRAGCGTTGLRRIDTAIRGYQFFWSKMPWKDGLPDYMALAKPQTASTTLVSELHKANAEMAALEKKSGLLSGHSESYVKNLALL